jgi:hypothetical protein
MSVASIKEFLKRNPDALAEVESAGRAGVGEPHENRSQSGRATSTLAEGEKGVANTSDAADNLRAKNSPQASELLGMVDGLVESGSLSPFHNEFREPFARVKVAAHFEILGMRSSAFYQWLLQLFFKTTGRVCNQQAIAAVRELLSARAIFDGPEHRLHNRVAWHDGAIWYDLSDPEWQAVKIGRDGWRIEVAPPILFRRFKHQRPQIKPEPGETLRTLFPFFNLPNITAKRLLATTVISFLVPDIPHAIPALYGEHGSAKTTLSSLIRRWVDPSETSTLGEPSRDQIMQILAYNYVVPLDNLRAILPWLSDVLCRAVTGDGLSKRMLFTDDDDHIYSFRRSIIVNGINALPQREDLLDRSILFHLPEIPKEERLEEAEVIASFKAVLPRILGATFTTLSKAMKVHDQLSLRATPRMADFARWGEAISQAADFGRRRFLVAYDQEATVRNDAAIEASPVAEAVRALARQKGETWKGTAGDLLAELVRVSGELQIDVRAREWPKQPNVLSRRLNEVTPNLRRAGIRITHGWSGNDKIIIVGIDGSEGSRSKTTTCISTKTDGTGDTIDDFETSGGQSGLPNGPGSELQKFI